MNPLPDYDSPWKEILDDFFEEFMAFFFPKAYAAIDWKRGVEFLDKELQKITADASLGRRFVDKLAKVWLKTGSELCVMIHTEVQGSRENDFEKRVFVYNYRILDRYHAPVASFVILTDEDLDWRPSEYRQELFGTSTIFKFETVKLLDYESCWEELRADNNVFAVVVMAHLRVLSTRRNDKDRLNWKLQLTRLLYERGYDKLTVIRLFKFLDWIMLLPKDLQIEYRDEMTRFEEEKQMPYITTIERMGIEQGLHQGLQQGLHQGLQQGSIRQLLRILRGRFGESADIASESLKKLSLEQLEELADKVISVQSLEEFIAAVPKTDGADQN